MTTVANPQHQDQRQDGHRRAAARGRDVIFEYLRTAGVDSLFGVPGTNEVPIIDGTDVSEYGIRYVQCLHENIALGAAMGHARATGRPGVVALHVTPGIAHALANLYNAAKSHVPVVVLCGQQHSNLLIQEPLLASDLVRAAEQYTKWSYEVRGPNEIGMAMQRALKVALTPPTGPVFLSIPWEFTLAEDVRDPDRGRFTRVAARFTGDADEVRRSAEILAGAASPIIVVGDGVGAADAWQEVAELAELLRAEVYSEPLSSYVNYPNTAPNWQSELPNTQDRMREVFEGHDVAFLCGFNAQAQLVIYDWDRGPLIPEGVKQVYLHNDPWQIGKNHFGEAAVLGDVKATLPLLTQEVGKRLPAGDRPSAADWLAGLARERETTATRYGTAAEDGRIPGGAVAEALGRLQKAGEAPGLVLVNEAVSDSAPFLKELEYDSPTSYFMAQGGSLGYSMPAALGFRRALGPERTVVNVVGDGSALFYPQSLWTAVKDELPILFVVLNNGEYKTLIAGTKVMEDYYRWQTTGDAAYLRLPPPPHLSFVDTARCYGVDGELVREAGQLDAALRNGLAAVRGQTPKPYLVEVLTSAGLPPMDRIGWADDFRLIP